MLGTNKKTNQDVALTDFRDKTAELKQNVKDLGSMAHGATRAKTAAMRHAAQARYDDVRQRSAQAITRSREQARRLGHTTTESVRQHPYRSLAIAAGAGLLAGFVLRSLLRQPPRTTAHTEEWQ